MTYEESELLKDFEYLYELCDLTLSTKVLPEAGGWNDQYPEFIAGWRIFNGELESAKAEIMKPT